MKRSFLPAPVEPKMLTYLHEKARRLGVPLSGNFELTSRCNFNCKMCYIHSDNSRKKEEELSAAQWIAIGEQAVKNGMAFLLLTGGEPLIREDFAQIYMGLKKLGLMISVNTNGSLLQGDILEMFKENPPLRLNISLYGASNKTYRNLCGCADYSKVVTNITNAVEAGIQVKLNYSITPYNCGDMEEIFRFAGEHNLNIQTSAYMYPPLRREDADYGENQGRLSPEQAAFYRVKSEVVHLGKDRFYEKIKNLDEVALEDAVSECGRGRNMMCRAGKSNCWVDWHGNMGMCGMVPAGDNNILEKGFSACWETVKAGAKKVILPQKCTECKYSAICNVCAAICLCETGRYDTAPAYLCRYSSSTLDRIMELKAEKE